MTDAEELTQVEAAIASILAGGQEISMRENSVRKGSLETLYKRKDYLVSRLDRATRGGIRVRGATPI